MKKIGVLGASKRGHGYHYAKRFNIKDENAPGLRARVTAVWDSEPAVARAFADDVPDVSIYQDPAQVAESTDGGMITTLDPYDYSRLASLWLQQGKPVFLNRPFAATPEDARGMIAMAEANNTRVWSASALAVSPHIARSTEKLAELGGPVFFSAAITSKTPLFYIPHVLTVAVGVVGTGARSVVASGIVQPHATNRLNPAPSMAEIPKLTGISALIDYGHNSKWGPFQGTVTFQAGECHKVGYELSVICAKGRLDAQDYGQDWDIFGEAVTAIERFFADGQMPTKIALPLEVCELYHAIRVSLCERRTVELAEFR